MTEYKIIELEMMITLDKLTLSNWKIKKLDLEVKCPANKEAQEIKETVLNFIDDKIMILEEEIDILKRKLKNA